MTGSAAPIASRANAPTALERLADLANRVDAKTIADEALALAQRLAEGRFYVACIGQFKRGKSTLLNALVGTDVLPTGVAPVTSVVTVLRNAPALTARVRTHDGRWVGVDPHTLAEYVAESGNPQNVKHIEAVEVFVPSRLLTHGLCLVDTPGVGSTLEGNTAVTRAFLPHIDAALAVLGGDPPVSKDELELIADLTARVDTLIVVLNKADRLSLAERSEAKAFTERVLRERLGRPLPPLLEVSALERSRGTRSLPDWDELVSRLEALAAESGSALVESAERRGLLSLAARLASELDEREGALTRPFEESERRIEALKRCAGEAERSMADLGALFGVEQQRLARAVAARRDRFLAVAVPSARAELAATLAAAEERRGPPLRRRGFTLAQDVFRRWAERWRSEEQPVAEQVYREATARFVALANGFLEKLAASGEPALASLPHALAPETGFRTKSRLHYTELLPLTATSPFRWLAELVVRPRGATRRAVERAGDYLEHLLTSNAARIMNDLNDRVAEGRRRLEAEVRRCLEAVYRAAERALEEARARRAAGEPAVRSALAEIRAWRREVHSIAANDRKEN